MRERDGTRVYAGAWEGLSTALGEPVFSNYRLQIVCIVCVGFTGSIFCVVCMLFASAGEGKGS